MLAVVFALLASCGPVERHRVLAFFFDGVPPLPGETGGSGFSDVQATEAAETARTGGWYVHKPLNDCTTCHGSQRKTFSREVHLVAGVPALCHACHENATASEGWVHGPVAAGECLLCHEPHKTRNPSLLVKPIPELCYGCHEPQAVRLIDNHADASYTGCTSCHDGHSSPTRGLLTTTFLEQPAGRSYLAELHRQQYEQAGKRTRDEIAHGGNLIVMLETAIGHIEMGRWWLARAYLEAIRDSGILTDQERPRVDEVLGQVTALSQTRFQGHPDDLAAGASLAGALHAICDGRRRQQQTVATRYFSSIKAYHAGQLADARQGFSEVLADPSVPAPMRDTARAYLEQIEKSLKGLDQPGWQLLK